MMREAGNDNVLGRRWGTANLLTLLTLAAFVVAFAFGALSWVRFFQANGDHTRLFTQTDFPAVVIGSRLVSAGRGG